MCPWVLIGAQMVILLEREAGRSSGRTTGDPAGFELGSDGEESVEQLSREQQR